VGVPSQRRCPVLQVNDGRCPETPDHFSTNGKAERLIKTLLEEWAYMMPYGTSTARNALSLAYLRINKGSRCQMALGGLTPQQRLAQLLA
jgi:hypothetical protein